MAKIQHFPLNAMRDELLAALGNAQVEVRKQIIAAVAEKIVKHRVDLVVRAWRMVAGLKKCLAETKPDIEQYDNRGNLVTGYTVNAMKAKRDKQKQINDLNNAVEQAIKLEQKDVDISKGWDALEELLKRFEQVTTFPNLTATDLVA